MSEEGLVQVIVAFVGLIGVLLGAGLFVVHCQSDCRKEDS